MNMQTRALALCVVLLAQVAFAQKTSIRQDTYKGWNAFILSNGTVEAIVVPQVGRVMQFRFAGEQDGPFWENEAFLGKAADPDSKEWQNFGGDKTWPSEQSQWPKIINREWPPPATFDSTPVKAIAEKKRIRLEYPVDPHYGIRVTRWVELDPQKNIMRIRTRYEKVQGDPVKVGVWVITQLKDPREVRLYKAANSPMKDGYVQVSGPVPFGLLVHDWGIALRRHPSSKLKVGSDGNRLEWFGNSWRLQINAHRYFDDAEYPEKSSSVQVYTNDDPDKYVELETQGPLRTMEKGDMQECVNTYTLTKN
jgi:hypothetical protein